jgi:peptidoglycan/xylan/chitin deacetylase (PgdA/CDA1 family)
MYHRLRDAARDPFSVTPDAFEQQMAWLAERGLVLSLAAVREHIEGRRSLPRGGVLVTIDDGYRDLHTVGLPILRRHHIPAVAFVTVGRLEERGLQCDADAVDAHLSWSELAELLTSGVTVASHGWEHVSLGQLSPTELTEQLTRSRRELEQRLGITVDAFAYPFGTRADFSRATEQALVDAGYALAFTAQHGAIRVGANPMALPRVKVEGGEGIRMFRSIVAGGLDAWGKLDRMIWRLQQHEAQKGDVLVLRALAPRRHSG